MKCVCNITVYVLVYHLSLSGNLATHEFMRVSSKQLNNFKSSTSQSL